MGSEALKPCPFCGHQLRESSVSAVHPMVDGGCFLEGTGMAADEYPLWNVRAPLAHPTPGDSPCK